ncbi:cyclic nucleotide-binding domain-containing protein [Halobacteriovorax sp. HLS]|uniref:cyclic nucleotide-binding domain-containing protein n=1 Tax=Halobacteriovorax sp. HLS TaxID=2234000 RepID=UPI000FDAEEB7|nr:cyclic nucleotide-binding domain-containing protein [Halobacteriovorax sp. HLS]
MIHIHKSKFTAKELGWHALIFLAVFFTALEAPFSLTYKTNIQTWQLWSDAIISLIFMTDVVLQFKERFFKKYPTHASKKSNNTIWWMMIAVDLMASIPYDVISYSFGLHGYHVFGLIRLLRLVRIARLYALMSNLALVPNFLRVSALFCVSIMVIHWIACGWSIIHPVMEKDLTTHYIKSLYWAITTLTTIGYGDITPTTNIGRIYTMPIMILGVGVYGFVIANVTRLFTTADRYKERSKEKINDVANYMKYYKIPERVQGQVFGYYNHLINKRFTDNDTTIISDLPLALQQELQTYMNMKHIRTVPVFKNCSNSCLKDVAGALIQKSYSPGQTIIRIGEIGNEMFMIGHGSVEVIFKDGTVVATLQEGQIFGEAALLRETSRNADVRAQNYCDLYILNKEDFVEIIKKHPDLLENMQAVTSRRATDRRKAA